MNDKQTYRAKALAVRADAQARLRELRAERLAKSRGRSPTAPASPQADPDLAHMSHNTDTGSGPSLSISPALRDMLNRAQEDTRSADMIEPVDMSEDTASDAPQAPPSGSLPDPETGHLLPQDDAAVSPATADPSGDMVEDMAEDAPLTEPSPNEAQEDPLPAGMDPEPEDVSTSEPHAEMPAHAPGADPSPTGPEPLHEEVEASGEPGQPLDPGPSAPPTDPDTRAAEDTQTDLYALPGIGSGLVWMLQKNGIGNLRDLAQADETELSAKLPVIGQLLNIGTWIDYAKADIEARPPQ